ncbi:MAG: LPXTG cell wall anchor domain-containing protein [Clostridia bacterium]|nr:MAG: LPXTG cell wall anchor domain-containing protein [Clostridia bacterium]
MKGGRIYLLVSLAVTVVLIFGVASVALASSQYIGQIPAEVENKTCTLCHTANYPELNAGGQAWVKAGKDWAVFTKAESKPEAAKEQPAAQPAAAVEKKAEKELPKTGGNPYLYIVVGAAMVMAGLFMGKRRAHSE